MILTWASAMHKLLEEIFPNKALTTSSKYPPFQNLEAYLRIFYYTYIKVYL